VSDVAPPPAGAARRSLEGFCAPSAEAAAAASGAFGGRAGWPVAPLVLWGTAMNASDEAGAERDAAAGVGAAAVAAANPSAFVTCGSAACAAIAASTGRVPLAELCFAFAVGAVAPTTMESGEASRASPLLPASSSHAIRSGSAGDTFD
jgi:hypothetical protein